jgi:hypothetical protein
MTKYFDDVISFARPTEVQDTGAVGRIVNFSTIHGNLSLSRCDTPHNRHIMFFSTTIRSSQSIVQSLLVWKSKSPVEFKIRKALSETEYVTLHRKRSSMTLTYHRIFRLVVATRFPDATALKSIW